MQNLFMAIFVATTASERFGYLRYLLRDCCVKIMDWLWIEGMKLIEEMRMNDHERYCKEG